MITLLKRFLIFHPLLFGIFPVLFLYAQNAREMRLLDIVAPLELIISFVIITTLLLGLILRDLKKSGLIVTIIVLLFFSYGHVVNALTDFRFYLDELEIGPNGLILPIWCILLYQGIKNIIKTRRNLLPLTKVLNAIGIALVAVQIIQGGVILASRQETLPTEEITINNIELPKQIPDIYYIVIDGYSRSDVLKEIYNFDNSNFINFLKESGFHIIERSHTNYCQTLLSLASSLNMNYIDSLGEYELGLKDRMPLAKKLWDNRIFKFFKELGYSIISFASGYSFTEFKNTDMFITPIWTTNEFQNILITTTPLPLFLNNSKSPYDVHRRRVSFTLAKLSKIDRANSPFFAFAHIVSPHPPFIFGANGEHVQANRNFSFQDGSHFINSGGTHGEYITGYTNQITYITKRLKTLIEELLNKSPENQPIIILQSDHGSGSGLSWVGSAKTNLNERFSIINALYLPDNKGNQIYDLMSPVNTFRIILNEYFNSDFKLLPDKSFYTTWAHPFNFRDITEQLVIENKP